ncbi:von Willebrand factor A domain-containing protein 7-like [Haliotis rubra]|uniref:von Willebrand factor A domain-containing protein 7-like n=1 Tax=Haliotis rubra TaxID=36100 RepID=UPI001EE4EB40|nr:von Willebrand factor A domain-containing protein 7-like [Haliotis rubra]
MLFTLLTVLTLISWPCARGFLPNQFTLLSSGSDYTHQDITEIGILYAVAEFFENNPLPGKSISPGALTGIKDITARKLFDKYYGGTVSEKRFQEAIDDIVKANNRVDQDHYSESAWHVNGEAIKEGNDKITLLRETAINVLNKTKTNPNLDAARELIGQFLHIVQMFYSNTNWPELSGKAAYESLGMRGKPLMAQAPSAMDTCRSCGSSTGIPCTANIIVQGPLLTSGYRSGQDRHKPAKDPATFKTGKCSHGGPYDQSGKTIAAIGGINKDTSDAKMSPHAPLHDTAAQGAIMHTRFLFGHPAYGLHSLIGDENFQELLQLTAGNSMVFVIDTTGSMGDDLAAVIKKTQEIIKETLGTINQPYNYIVVTFNDPGNKTDIFKSKNGTAVMNYLSSLSVHGGGDCPEFSLTGLQAAATVANPNSKVYVFTDASPKDAAKINYVTSMVTEKKIAVSFILTGDCSRRKRNSGRGTVQFNPKTPGFDIQHITSSYSARPNKIPQRQLPLLSEFSLGGLSINMFHVDNTVKTLLIGSNNNGGVRVFNPYGELVPVTQHEEGELIVEAPKPGKWAVKNDGSDVAEVSIYGNSVLDIKDNMVKTNDNGHSMFIEGKPVVGESVTHAVAVTAANAVSSIDSLILYNTVGEEIDRCSLTHRKKRGHNFVASIAVPDQPYRMAIEGRDNDGHLFQRQKPDLIKPSTLSLSVERVVGDLQVGSETHIHVKVINKGRNSERVKLDVADSLKLAVTSGITLNLQPGENTRRKVVIAAGRTPDVSTTVTIMATAIDAPEDFQYVTRTFTVHSSTL